jgi:4-oxalocrotonate tautomerase
MWTPAKYMEPLMPYLQIFLSPGQLNAAHQLQLAADATRLLDDILHKRPEVTVVQFVSTPSDAWFAAGSPLPQFGRAAYAEVKITQGSNSEAEKARFLAAFHRLLEDTVGLVSVPTYVVIHEIPCTDWGYDGISQAERGGRP